VTLPGGLSYFPLGSVTLDAYHPTVPFGTSIATVLPDVHGFLGNQLAFMPLTMPPSGAVSGFPVAVTGTDAYSRQPAAASNGSGVMILWRQGNGMDSTSTLGWATFDTAGTETGAGTLAGDSTTDLGQPQIVSTDTGYAAVAVLHLGAGLDQVQFMEIAADGTPVEGTNQYWTVTELDNLVVGSPALARGDGQYAILWEEGGGATAAHFHLSQVDAGGTSPRDATLESALAPSTGAFTANQQPGMIDVAWTGSRYGVAWVHSNVSLSRIRAWFFELGPSGALIGTPELLNPDGTQTQNPSIAWLQTSTQYYYVFLWNEFSSASGVHVLYSYSYGCTAS
jgi:hypothetical protein